MGKNLVQQARGKGGPTYRAQSHRSVARVKYIGKMQELSGIVQDLVNCPGHSAPLVKIKFENGELSYAFAVKGIKVGDTVKLGHNDVTKGNIVHLRDLPEGSLINNIESSPGDGGKFVRAAGTFARVVISGDKEIVVELPSKKKRNFNPLCRATVGTIAGSGRDDKPFVKAGQKFYAMKAKNKLYPRVRGRAQNSVDHPHGGGDSTKKNTSSHSTSPGAKVGLLSPKRTGRGRGKRRIRS